MWRWKPVEVGLLLVILAGCRGDAGLGRSEVVEWDSLGVRIVENNSPDAAAPWAVEVLRPILSPDGALTPLPWGVSADPMGGRLYVLDAQGQRVLVFDQNGEHLQSLGRGGEGPGEFLTPVATAVDRYGALAVWDVGRGVLTRWSTEGDLLNEERAPIQYWGPDFHASSGGLTTVLVESSDRGLEQRLVEVQGEDVRVLHSVMREWVMLELPCITQPAFRVLAPSVVWGARNDTVHVLAGTGFRIDTFVSGTRVRSLRRSLPPVPVTTEVAARRAEQEYGAIIRLCGVTAEEVVRALGHEPEVSPVQLVAPAPDGRLWVSRSLDGIPPVAVDIFHPEGRYEGTLELPGMPVAFLSSTRVVTLAMRPETEELYLMLNEARPEEGGDRERTGPDGTDSTGAIPRDPRVREFRDCPQCPVMLAVPPGTFLMGAPDDEDRRAGIGSRPEWVILAERPQVEVSFGEGFALGKLPVTFAEWDRCVAEGGCTHTPGDAGWGRGDRPVIHVSRSDAEEYVGWLSRVTGVPYRLPSEAEWEYAARAGTTTARWWGDELGRGRATCDGCGTRWDDRSTAPVGSFPPNPFGFHDLLGNVSEWVADCWHPSHEGAHPDGSPRTETSPEWRNGRCEAPVHRGGAYSYFPWTVRAAQRGYHRGGEGVPWTERDSSARGFRVARDLIADDRTEP